MSVVAAATTSNPDRPATSRSNAALMMARWSMTMIRIGAFGVCIGIARIRKGLWIHGDIQAHRFKSKDSARSTTPADAGRT